MFGNYSVAESYRTDHLLSVELMRSEDCNRGKVMCVGFDKHFELKDCFYLLLF